MAAGRKTPRTHRAGAKTETLSVDADAVRHWRLQRGWTQEALSQQRVTIDGQIQSLSYAQIRRIEREGRCGPTSARILSALLDVPLASLAPRDHRQLPCGLPREPSIDFVGRDLEIKEVLNILQGRSSVRSAASIEGLPGIGKTELALQICGLCEKERRFRIFWFDAEQPDLTSIWADIVAPHLGIEEERSAQRASRAVRAIEALTEPVLFVLDNVEEWTASSPWPRPRGSHIHWLVTTRRAGLAGREFHHVDVPALDPAASERLMVQIAGTQLAERPGFTALLEALGGYTIAIELAATFLQRFPEIEPAEYRAELERGRGEELAEEVGPRTFYGHTLERALELLWARLPPRVRSAWQLAAQFADVPASAELSDACGLDRRMRAELRDYHLIASRSARGWSMHRLVRAFGRSEGTPEQRAEFRRAFLRGCMERIRTADIMSGFRFYAPDRDHFDSTLAQDPRAAQGEIDSLCRLWDRIAVARISLGELETSIEIVDRALALALRELPPSSPILVRLRANRGCALFLSGALIAARDYLESSLETALEHVGVHEYVGELRATLGLVLKNLGEFGRSQEQLRLAIEVYETAVGPALADLPEDHPDVLGYRGNLGYLMSLAGDPQCARTVLEQSLEGKRRALPDHPSIGNDLVHLAQLLMQLGDLAAARPLLEEAVETALGRLGEQHPVVALRRRDLAEVLFWSGELQRARELYEAALGGGLRELPHGHPAVGIAQQGLARVVRELGQPERARELAEEALQVTGRQFGEAHVLVENCRLSLAWALLDLGDAVTARGLMQRSIDFYTERAGLDEPGLASTCHALGVALAALGDRDGARSALERALDTILRGTRQGHVEATRVRADLAAVLCDLGDLAGARGQLEQALAADRKQGRISHLDSVLAQARLVDVLRQQGELTSARELAREAARIASAQPRAWYRHAEIERHCGSLLEPQTVS